MHRSDPSTYITSLSVERDCAEEPYTREIIDRCGLPVKLVDNGTVPELDGLYPANLTSGKKHLFLCRNRGRFMKPCPGTKEYRCCDYQVLNIGMNCPMDCVYCILQAYLNNPWLSYFVNIDDLFTDIELQLQAEPERIFRIGTGEFTDSLALDRLTGLSTHLVPFMGRSKNGYLELKTKSAVIDNLRKLDHNGRTIVSWSLNSPAIAKKEELRTAGLAQRLAAAAACQEWGYRIGFHFDPIIHHPGWKDGYRSIIRQIFRQVDREGIAWISLGALRYIPSLKTIATDRFPGSRFFYNEFVPGLDGKSRYFRSQRVEMYRLLVDELMRQVSDRTCVYFCMESNLIWKEILGFTPEERGGLAAMLEKAVT